jgi:hypothetical protein
VESFSGRIDSLEKGQRKIFMLLEQMKEIKSKVDKIELKEEIAKELHKTG